MIRRALMLPVRWSGSSRMRWRTILLKTASLSAVALIQPRIWSSWKVTSMTQCSRFSNGQWVPAGETQGELPTAPAKPTGPRGRAKQHQVTNLHARSGDHKTEVLASPDNCWVPVTNNQRGAGCADEEGQTEDIRLFPPVGRGQTLRPPPSRRGL